MIENKIDFNEKRNLMISSVILVIGIGNAYLQLGKYQFSGLAVAAVLGIIMNLILPQKAKSEMEFGFLSRVRKRHLTSYFAFFV